MTFDTEDEEVGTAPEAVGETDPFPDERVAPLVPLAGSPGSLGSASLITPPLEVAALVTQLIALGWEAAAVPAHVPTTSPSVAAQTASPLQRGKTATFHGWWIAARPQLGNPATGGAESATMGEDSGESMAHGEHDRWDLLPAASWALRLRQQDTAQRRPSRAAVAPRTC